MLPISHLHWRLLEILHDLHCTALPIFSLPLKFNISGQKHSKCWGFIWRKWVAMTAVKGVLQGDNILVGYFGLFRIHIHIQDTSSVASFLTLLPPSTLHPAWVRVLECGVVVHSSMASGSWKMTVGRGSFRRVRTFNLVFSMVWKCYTERERQLSPVVVQKNER